MDEKLIKLNKGLTLTLKGFAYAAIIIFLVVGILGYVFSYSYLTAYLHNEDAIPRLIYIIGLISLFFIGFVGAFVFIICGKKFNLKNAITIALGVPLELLTLAGYLLASEHLTIAYDVANKILSILAIVAAFLAGMKFILLIIREYKLIKETTPSKDFDDKNKD